MNDPYDLIFSPSTFHAEIVFAGTRCGHENLHSDYANGCMHFIREGTARLKLADGQALAIDEPSLVFVPRAARHDLQARDAAGFSVLCALTRFSEPFERTVALSFPPVVVIPLSLLAAVRHVLEGLFAEVAAPRPGSRHLADRLATVVLAYVARHVYEQGAGPARGTLFAASADRRIATAIATIHARYHEPLDLNRLAQACGMSRSRFAALFRHIAGITPHDYLVSYRMGVAQQLLGSGIPVKAVAPRVGYATTSAFVRRFREVVGVPPGAWAR